jgi:hypothetical protein
MGGLFSANFVVLSPEDHAFLNAYLPTFNKIEALELKQQLYAESRSGKYFTKKDFKVTLAASGIPKAYVNSLTDAIVRTFDITKRGRVSLHDIFIIKSLTKKGVSNEVRTEYCMRFMSQFSKLPKKLVFKRDDTMDRDKSYLNIDGFTGFFDVFQSTKQIDISNNESPNTINDSTGFLRTGHDITILLLKKTETKINAQSALSFMEVLKIISSGKMDTFIKAFMKGEYDQDEEKRKKSQKERLNAQEMEDKKQRKIDSSIQKHKEGDSMLEHRSSNNNNAVVLDTSRNDSNINSQNIHLTIPPSKEESNIIVN